MAMSIVLRSLRRRDIPYSSSAFCKTVFSFTPENYYSRLDNHLLLLKPNPSLTEQELAAFKLWSQLDGRLEKFPDPPAQTKFEITKPKIARFKLWVKFNSVNGALNSLQQKSSPAKTETEAEMWARLNRITNEVLDGWRRLDSLCLDAILEEHFITETFQRFHNSYFKGVDAKKKEYWFQLYRKRSLQGPPDAAINPSDKMVDVNNAPSKASFDEFPVFGSLGAAPNSKSDE